MAAAWPTFRESMPVRGIRTRTSAACMAVSDSPGPSAPTITAGRPTAISPMGVASGAGVMATSVNPARLTAARSAAHESERAIGTEKRAPIDTRTLRRYHGSAVVGSTSTPAIPSPTAARSTAPRFSWSFTPSMTASDASSRSEATGAGSGRRADATTPRCRSNPTTADIVWRSTTNTGTDPVAGRRWCTDSRHNTDSAPSSEPSRRVTTANPSAMKSPEAASNRRRKPTSLSRR